MWTDLRKNICAAVLAGVFLSAGSSALLAQRTIPRQSGGLGRDQTPVFKIQGRVQTENQQSVPEMLEVRLEKDGAPVKQTYLPSDDNFEFTNLPEGSYKLVIRPEKFEDVNLNVDVSGRVSQTFYIHVVLVPKGSEAHDANKLRADDDLADTVSVMLLSQKIPSKAQKCYRKSLDLQNKKKYPQAIQQLKQAIALSPEFYSAQRNLGILYMLSESPSEAISPLEAALKINPKSAKVNYTLGLATLRLSDLPHANDYFSRVVSLAPNQAGPHYFQGYIAYKQGRLKDAEASLRKAIAAGGELKSYSRLQLANVYLRQSDLEDAYQQTEMFLKEQPTAQEVSQVIANLKILRELMGRSPDRP
jgi:Flp pilus assembly protein TadD